MMNNLEITRCFALMAEPKMVRVDTDRFTKHKMDFFDCNWERIPNAGRGILYRGAKSKNLSVWLNCWNTPEDFQSHLSMQEWTFIL